MVGGGLGPREILNFTETVTCVFRYICISIYCTPTTSEDDFLYPRLIECAKTLLQIVYCLISVFYPIIWLFIDAQHKVRNK